jgi:hypothetical protein
LVAEIGFFRFTVMTPAKAPSGLLGVIVCLGGEEGGRIGWVIGGAEERAE